MRIKNEEAAQNTPWGASRGGPVNIFFVQVHKRGAGKKRILGGGGIGGTDSVGDTEVPHRNGIDPTLNPL